VSSTQSKKTYNQITTWYIYSNGAKTKDIKQVFVSEESVAYGSPKITTTTETKSETVAGEPIITVKETLIENPIVDTTVTESEESSLGDRIAGDPVITYSDWTTRARSLVTPALAQRKHRRPPSWAPCTR
jgi:hypothetical protein